MFQYQFVAICNGDFMDPKTGAICPGVFAVKCADEKAASIVLSLLLSTIEHYVASNKRYKDGIWRVAWFGGGLQSVLWSTDNIGVMLNTEMIDIWRKQIRNTNGYGDLIVM